MGQENYFHETSWHTYKAYRRKKIYNGRDIYHMEDEYRDILGYLPQEFGLYKNFSAKKFFQYVAVLRGLDKKQANRKIDELLNLVGLYDVRNEAVVKFSGGMKRRAGIAQALLNDPKRNEFKL